MPSAPLSALTSLQLNDYATLTVLTTVAYDYFLTFGDEIKYIWKEPWSHVSTLFILVRYLGIFNLITCVLLGSSFLPGPEKSQGEVIDIVDTWVFYVFLAAADYVMMLRVWAIYDRSKLILRFLLTIFFIELISSFIGAAAASDPRHLSAPVIRVMDDSYCVVMSATRVWSSEATVFRMINGTAIFLLTIVQFVRQSIRMYHATKQWQPGRYFNLLTTQGIFYFFAIFLYDVIILIADVGKYPAGGWQLIVLIILNYVPIFILTPRFILRIRELYARDVQVRCSEGIDTGFGMSASASDGSMSALVFADMEQRRGPEEEEAASEEVDAAQTV